MENLDLPNLRELFLHRNEIMRIGNLSGCPRLRRLWLFQNKITSINGLHAVPELMECWLQGNDISKLGGFEHSSNLVSLGLAGNPISDFNEVKKLTECPKLSDLSFNDIHFGRSFICDEIGYKEYMLLHFRKLKLLDGVKVSKEKQLAAEDAYYAQVIMSNPRCGCA